MQFLDIGWPLHRQKVVRACGVLNIFTFKFALRHNGVHFLHISSSKSGPNVACFVHYHFQMCFAPQRRVLFNISTSKSAPTMRCFVHFTSKSASRHNGLQLFMSHLPRCLRTRRFSEPTLRYPGATKHWKNTVFRDFSTFSRTCIFSLLTFSISSLLTSDLLFHLSILSEA